MDLLDDDGLLDLRSRARRTDPAAVTEEERQRRRDTEDTNSDLREWLAGQRVAAAPEREGADPDACHVCKQRNAKYRCAHCRHGACAAHHWVMFGLCHRCATEDRIARWHAERRPEADNWLDLGGPEVRP